MIVEGNPDDLFLPHDSEGRVCGKTTGVENKPFLFFFDITKCLLSLSPLVSCPTPQVCVEKCPNVYAHIKIPNQETTVKEFCHPTDQTNCPTYLVESIPIFGRCVPSIIFQLIPKTTVIRAFDNETNSSIPIKDFLDHDLTFDTLQKSVDYLSDFLNLRGIFESVYEDIKVCRWIILIGLLYNTVY